MGLILNFILLSGKTKNVIVGLSARIVYRQASLVNITIKR